MAPPTSFEFDNKQHYLNVNGNTTGTYNRANRTDPIKQEGEKEDVTRAPLGG